MLEPGCEHYSFLDQAVEDYKGCLDAILTDSIKTPELDVPFDEPDIMPSSVSSALLYLDITISDNSRSQLLLATNLIHYGARLGCDFCLYHCWAKCQPQN